MPVNTPGPPGPPWSTVAVHLVSVQVRGHIEPLGPPGPHESLVHGFKTRTRSSSDLQKRKRSSKTRVLVHPPMDQALTCGNVRYGTRLVHPVSLTPSLVHAPHTPTGCVRACGRAHPHPYAGVRARARARHSPKVVRMINARPTLYRGVRMRSRLEARAAQIFDAAGFTWEYEPECFADESDQYLPDFLIDRATYVEIKPEYVFRDGEAVTRVMRRMEIVRSSKPDAILYVYCPELNECYTNTPWDNGEWFHQGPAGIGDAA